VVTKDLVNAKQTTRNRAKGAFMDANDNGLRATGLAGVDGTHASTEATITGYACACPDTSAPTRPSVILDPFGGTGTTAAVASALGRIGISVDLSHDYSRLAQWRTTDPATRAKIRGERPPVKQADGPRGMFEEAS
jgi:hypothetical protein